MDREVVVIESGNGSKFDLLGAVLEKAGLPSPGHLEEADLCMLL